MRASSPEAQASLSGLLVISMDQAVAAPFAASRLAEAGARVIKVERPGGDFARNYDRVAAGESSYFAWLNRGKQSVELDIKVPEDLDLLRRMVSAADVFIENLAPGALARAGLDLDGLRASNPRLVTCSVTGYGDDGEYRDMKAYDMLIQAESGLAAITGSPEAPGRVGVSLADIAAGLYAYSGILQALFERERTGQGRHVGVSLFDAMADWMTVPLLHHDYGGRAPGRVGLAHPSIAPYEAFASADGDEVVIAIQNEREWVRFCADVLGEPDMAADARFCSNEARVANRDALKGRIGGVFAGLSTGQVTGRLNAAKIAFGFINGVDGLSSHPQLTRVPVETPGGAVGMPSPAVRFDRCEVQPGAVPGLGEHTDMIRAEFGAVALPEAQQR